VSTGASTSFTAQRAVVGDRVRWTIVGDAQALIAAIAEMSAAGIGGWSVTATGEGAWTLERPIAQSLSQWIDASTGGIAWSDACARAIEIAGALAWCEAHDRYVGPLAPESVLVVDGRTVIAADEIVERMLGVAEGIATRSDAGRMTKWMAPEQAGGAAWDHAANRYVVGLILYRMLAGAHPFAGLGLRRALEEQSNRGAPPFPEAIASALPVGLQSFVLRLLDPDPQARPRHARAIVERLADLGAVRTTTAAPMIVQAVSAQPIATAPRVAAPSVVAPRPAAPAPARARGFGRFAWILVAIPIAGGVALGQHLSDGVTAPSPPARARVGERAPLSSAQTDADDCATCHPEHAAQWHGSVMAHSVKSPLFQALEILIQEQGGREIGCESGAGLLRPTDGRTSCRDRTTGVEVTGAGGALWCVNCHAPASNLGAQIPAWNGLAAASPSRRPLVDLLSPDAMDGISCAFCHQVDGPVKPGDAARGDYEGNPDWISTATGVRFAARPEDRTGVFGIANSGYSLDPREFLLGAGARWPVTGEAHGRPSPEAKAYLASSEFCGTCHDVRLFGTDAVHSPVESFKRLRNAYSEWRDWADDERRAGRTPASCQDCHMSTFPGVCETVADADSSLGQIAAGATALARACPPGTAFAPRAPGSFATGSVASGSTPQDGVAPHYFSGVDVPLSPEFPDALVDDPTLDAFGIPRGAKQRRDLLLGRTFRFEIDGASRRGAQLEIPIVLENVGAGHRVPAGFSQEREFWVHLVVKDGDGRVVYEVGRVDRDDEDLRDKLFVAVNVDDNIVDANGRPQGMFGADVIDGPDVPLWDPSPLTGATNVRGRGLVNLQNGFLRCVTCIGTIDDRGRCQPGFGQGRHRADRFADGEYDVDTGECTSNLVGSEKFFETFFPVGGLDSTRGTLKAPDAIIDTRSAPPNTQLRFTYELDVGSGRGPYEIEARLLFRAFPPFLVAAFADYEARMDARGLRPSGPLVTRAMLERLEIVELHRLRVTLQ
jgi:hypothetical protein